MPRKMPMGKYKKLRSVIKCNKNMWTKNKKDRIKYISHVKYQ